MEPDAPHPLVLVCDHRGGGLDALVREMGTVPWRVAVSVSVAGSLERIAAGKPERGVPGTGLPEVLVVDPLVEGGAAEIEALRAAVAQAGETQDPERTGPGIVLLFDPSRPEPALLAAARAGACAFDAMPRNARADELRMRIERVLAQCARERELADLRHRALHDDGTGLLRPRAFHQRLVEHYGAAERHRLDLALVLVDLDRFGSFNKRFDHTVGDRVLARVSEAIRASLRAEDVAGRIGGDEFAVLLPYTRRVEAAHVARRLLERIRDASGMFPGADARIEVAASVGFETFDGTDLQGVEALRAHAEIALRAAKRAGGDRGVYYRALG